MYKSKYDIAIVGATGLVGQTLLKIFEEENFPIDNLYLFASKKSKGKEVLFINRTIKINCLEEDVMPRCDFIFMMTDKAISKRYANEFTKKAVVIDNSSLYRLSKNVPLVVSEINGDKIKNSRLIANPNCTTAICAIPINILHQNYGVTRITVTSFQAVSGNGKEGLTALINHNANNFYPYDITKTCIPQIGKTHKNGYTEEELKIKDEMRKIMKNYDIQISATCVRVPIKNCHSLAVSATLNKPFSLNKIRKLFSQDKNLILLDDCNNNKFPTATFANDKNQVLVGRLRKDSSLENTLLF